MGKLFEEDGQYHKISCKKKQLNLPKSVNLYQ